MERSEDKPQPSVNISLLLFYSLIDHLLQVPSVRHMNTPPPGLICQTGCGSESSPDQLVKFGLFGLLFCDSAVRFHCVQLDETLNPSDWSDVSPV